MKEIFTRRRLLMVAIGIVIGAAIAWWLRRPKQTSMLEGFEATPALDATLVLQNRCGLLDAQIKSFEDMKARGSDAEKAGYDMMIQAAEDKKTEYGCTTLPPPTTELGSLSSLPEVPPPAAAT